MKHLLTFFLFLVFSFSASSQTVCDSLDFISIKYSPFTDSVIVVHVENNNSNEIFDYPGFVIIDDNGDTLAKETVNYFGIGSESVHLLEVSNGVHDPLDNFSGQLELFTGFYDTQVCTWPLDQSLCADSPCDSLVIGFQNWGGALVLGDFAWSVSDTSGSIIESGVLTMTTNEQYWFHGLCLAPGTYSYSLSALGEPSGGGPTLTVSSSSSFASPTISAPLDWFNDPGAEIEFPFFLHCAAESPNGVQELQTEAVTLIRNGDQLSVTSANEMELIVLYAVDGKLLGSFAPNTNRFDFPSQMKHGMYFARIKMNGVWMTEKFTF
ncbi:MAG: T9SS type A sorting domain-containing protein [Flavobacteriales bacterium]|nr:T9SS type A sorting domain-containing protein [Flavobacteriales bacterium]